MSPFPGKTPSLPFLSSSPRCRRPWPIAAASSSVVVCVARRLETGGRQRVLRAKSANDAVAHPREEGDLIILLEETVDECLTHSCISLLLFSRRRLCVSSRGRETLLCLSCGGGFAGWRSSADIWKLRYSVGGGRVGSKGGGGKEGEGLWDLQLQMRVFLGEGIVWCAAAERVVEAPNHQLLRKG